MRKFAIVAGITMATIINGCSVNTDTGKEEPVAIAQEQIIAPGMWESGYNPLVPGTLETIAVLDPALGDSLENIVFKDGKAFGTSILSGSVIVIDLATGSVQRVPVPVPPGTFMAGIDESPDSIVFASASFGEFGPDHSTVWTMDPSTLAISEVVTIPTAALNGLQVLGDSWYSVDALTPVIWQGSLSGDPATVWYSGPAVMPDYSYTGMLCGPPMPIGGNGLRYDSRWGQQYFVVSNTTGQAIWAVPVNDDGTSGTEILWYDDATYADDVWPDGCGIPGVQYPKGAFLANHGLQQVLYFNPWMDEYTEILDGIDCDGATAAVVEGIHLVVTCAGDALICRPDANGDPDPTIPPPGAPALKRVQLRPGYRLMCQP